MRGSWARFYQALALSACIALASSAEGQISVSVSTNKFQYQPGEALDVFVTAHNSAAASATLTFGSTRQSFYNLDNLYTFPQGGFDVITEVTIPAGGEHTWTYRHSWRSYMLSPGNHLLYGQVPGYGRSGNEVISALAHDPVFFEGVIDFDSLPGTDRVQTLEEYWQIGVRFRSMSSNDPVIHSRGTSADQYLDTSSTVYPPGFNIIADLEVPVFGASVDVSGGLGRTITLIAKDQNGNVLDSATSGPVVIHDNFQPLSVASPDGRPIAHLEWWPSVPQASVAIDNLQLFVPEPGGFLLLASAILILPRRRQR